MKKKYIVYITLGNEDINMAICDTKDIAIECSRKINEYISNIIETLKTLDINL